MCALCCVDHPLNKVCGGLVCPHMLAAREVCISFWTKPGIVRMLILEHIFCRHVVTEVFGVFFWVKMQRGEWVYMHGLQIGWVSGSCAFRVGVCLQVLVCGWCGCGFVGGGGSCVCVGGLVGEWVVWVMVEMCVSCFSLVGVGVP